MWGINDLHDFNALKHWEDKSKHKLTLIDSASSINAMKAG